MTVFVILTVLVFKLNKVEEKKKNLIGCHLFYISFRKRGIN